jgi:hypothetical protein
LILFSLLIELRLLIRRVPDAADRGAWSYLSKILTAFPPPLNKADGRE